MFIYILHSHLQVLVLRLKKNEKFFSNRFAILEQCHFSIKRLKLFGRIDLFVVLICWKFFLLEFRWNYHSNFVCLANFMNHIVICIIDIIINTRAIKTIHHLFSIRFMKSSSFSFSTIFFFWTTHRQNNTSKN